MFFSPFLKKSLFAISFLPLFFAPLANAQTSNLYGQSETRWTGVKLKVVDLVRTDSTHVVAVVHLVADATAPSYTYIGENSKATPPPHATASVLSSAKYDPIPYSLAISKLIDETTQQEFKADPETPEGFSSNKALTNLFRNGLIKMAVSLNVPPPQPPGPDGKIPPQRVTFLFPKTLHAIEHVTLPNPTPAVKAAGAPTSPNPR